MSENIYNFKKADFVCTCIILAVCLLTTVYNFSGKSLSEGIDLSIPVFLTAAIVIGLLFIPIPSRIKGFIYSLIILAASIMALIDDPSDQGTNFTISASIVVLCLYYSSKLLITYAVILNATYITVFNINSTILFNQERPVSFLLSSLLLINSMFLVIFFSNRWGSEIIRKATVKEQEVNELLFKLQSTFHSIEDSSSVLNKNLTQLDSNMNSIVESSYETKKTMNEIAKGTEHQADSINEINNNMSGAIHQVNSTKDISVKISTNSKLISEKVAIGSEKISTMNSKMNTINQAVSAALSTVTVLQTNIEEINVFLSGISQISEQTKLLSLNASIESARAGEQAEEVRKLALQSALTTTKIKEITKVISENSEEAVQTVRKGERAVVSGNVIMNEVSEYFSDVESAVNETFQLLETENIMIGNILERFIQVQERIESIASISEEHSASNEEILATIENENTDMISIKSAIQEIKEMSSYLNQMIQNGK